MRKNKNTYDERKGVDNMKQELIEIVRSDQIDQETARRLATCIDSEFKSSPIRYFRTRKVIIAAATNELLSIRISGFGESFRGRQLTCRNVDNPENLEVSMAESEMVLQSANDPDVLYVKGGETSITGPKYSDVKKDLDTPSEVLKSLPRKDPDIVQIDNRIYRQTGTVYINGSSYVVILER
jgi:hypothetical protein